MEEVVCYAGEWIVSLIKSLFGDFLLTAERAAALRPSVGGRASSMTKLAMLPRERRWLHPLAAQAPVSSRQAWLWVLTAKHSTWYAPRSASSAGIYLGLDLLQIADLQYAALIPGGISWWCLQPNCWSIRWQRGSCSRLQRGRWPQHRAIEVVAELDPNANHLLGEAEQPVL